MNRIGIVVLGAALAASFCYGQGSTSAPAQTAPAAIGHGAVPVKVVKTLDSSKLKEGDTIEVATAGSFKLADGTLVPKGSKLTGQVMAAKARSKGDPDSQLTLTFDKLNVANGKQITVKGTVQAVFPPQEEAEPLMAGKASGAAGGGYTGPTVGTVTDQKSGSSMESSANAQPVLSPTAVGVQGMHGLELKDGVLTSKGKNVKLGDGVRMIVHVDIFG
ncbi:MAG: hypothetical protein ABR881_25415 [Candidatus Sulfotelmatobacter sp.]|jgi:hypothetical protein